MIISIGYGIDWVETLDQKQTIQKSCYLLDTSQYHWPFYYQYYEQLKKS